MNIDQAIERNECGSELNLKFRTCWNAETVSRLSERAFAMARDLSRVTPTLNGIEDAMTWEAVGRMSGGSSDASEMESGCVLTP